MDIKERFYRNLQEARTPSETKKWKVSYDYGPHMSNHVEVDAKSENDAWAKTKRVAKSEHGHSSISHNWSRVVTEEQQTD